VSAACPAVVPTAFVSDKTAIASRTIAANPPPALAAATPAPTASTDEGVKAALDGWASAWRSRDVAGYLAFYASDFVPAGGMSREAWTAQRKQRVGRADAIQLRVDDVSYKTTGKDSASTTFRQTYRSGAYADVVTKQIDWARVDGKWKILRESVR
jgi:ketosteroid isomerase-like protein